MRIGLNIPDDLVRRLDPLKPQLNLSEVCREAIAKHVERYEAEIGNLDDAGTEKGLSQVAEEEIEHWMQIDFDWEALGYEDAVSWVASATWKDWDAWRTAQEFLERQDRPAWDIQPRLIEAPDKTTKTFNDRFWEYHAMIQRQSDELLEWLDQRGIRTDWEAAERDYGRAWVAYLRTVWQMICARRDEHLECLRQQRLEARKNRPQPSIPEHLFSDEQT